MEQRTSMNPALRVFKVAGIVLAGITAAVLFAALFSFIVQYIWNWLMPGLFGFQAITYLQAFAMIVLAKILFGGFGHNHHRSHNEGHWPWKRKNKPASRDTASERYRAFWDEEGEEAFSRYLERTSRGKDTADQ